jgi:hypothetical protein
MTLIVSFWSIYNLNKICIIKYNIFQLKWIEFDIKILKQSYHEGTSYIILLINRVKIYNFWESLS